MSLHLTPMTLGLSTLWLIAIDLAAWTIGAWIWRRVAPESGGSPLERLAFALVLGLTVLGSGALLLTLARCLYRWLIEALIFALATPAIVALIRRAKRAGPGQFWTWRRPRRRAALTTLAIAALLCFLPVCYVPTVPHDSVVYHLTLPEQYLRHHRFETLPYNVNANMPHNVEMLFVPAMAGGGVVAATLLMFQWSVLTLVGFVFLTARLGLAHLAGPVCLLFLASPLVQWHIPITHIEPALSCLLLYALALLLHWRRGGGRPALAACCWLVGWAMGSKYTVWYMAAGVPLSLVLIAVLRRDRPGQVLRSLGLGLAAMSAPVLPWLIRQAVAVGDPFYPNLHALLRTPWWSPVLQLQTSRLFTHNPILKEHGPLTTFLRKPWDLVNNARNYQGSPFSGLLMVLFLTAFLLPSSYRGGRKYIMLVAGLGYLSWALVPVPNNQARYLVALAAPMALAAGLVLAPLRRKSLLWSAALVAVCVDFIFGFSPEKVKWDRLAKNGLDKTYQEQNPSLATVEALNRRLPADVRLLFMFDNLTLGLERERWVETLYEAPSSMALIRGSKSSDEAAARLRGLGFTHLVMNRHNAQTFYFGRAADATDERIFPRELLDREKRLLDDLLKKRAVHLFDVSAWSVYALPS